MIKITGRWGKIGIAMIGVGVAVLVYSMLVEGSMDIARVYESSTMLTYLTVGIALIGAGATVLARDIRKVKEVSK
jgi:lipopolysaccharide export LptBFGC system permease protein LptF